MLRILRSSIQLAMFDLEIEAVVGRGGGGGEGQKSGRPFEWESSLSPILYFVMD